MHTKEVLLGHIQCLLFAFSFFLDGQYRLSFICRFRFENATRTTTTTKYFKPIFFIVRFEGQQPLLLRFSLVTHSTSRSILFNRLKTKKKREARKELLIDPLRFSQLIRSQTINYTLYQLFKQMSESRV